MICPLGGAVVHIQKFNEMQRSVQLCHVGHQNDQYEEHIQVDESHAQVVQLEEVDLGEHGHCHEEQNSNELGHVGYYIDQHEKHNQIKCATCKRSPTSRS